MLLKLALFDFLAHITYLKCELGFFLELASPPLRLRSSHLSNRMHIDLEEEVSCGMLTYHTIKDTHRKTKTCLWLWLKLCYIQLKLVCIIKCVFFFNGSHKYVLQGHWLGKIPMRSALCRMMSELNSFLLVMQFTIGTYEKLVRF